MNISFSYQTRKSGCRDFPGGPVVKNLPCNAGNVGSIPGWGTKIPHYLVQLSPTALEPMHHDRDPLHCN